MVISFIFQTLHQSLQDLIPIIVLLFKDNRTTASALRYCYTVGIWSYLFNMAQHINKILLLFVAVLHSLNKYLLWTDPSQRIKKLWEIFLKHSYGLQWGIQQSQKIQALQHLTLQGTTGTQMLFLQHAGHGNGHITGSWLSGKVQHCTK